MGFLKLSIRQRIAVLAITVTGLLAPTSLIAQDKGPGAAVGTQPVVVVTLGSINKLMQDVNYLSGVIGQPQAGGMFTMMAGGFTQGIDTTQPIAVMVPMVNGMPEPIGMIPTADVKTVLKRREGQIGPADELDDGTLVIAVGPNTLFIRQSGNWAILARNKDLLSLAPADPSTLIGNMGTDYDLALRVRMQEVPVETRNMLVAQMRRGFEQAMAQQEGPDAETSRKMAESTITQIEQIIQETDELKMGFNIDQTNKQLVFDGAFTAVPGSKLSEMYGDQAAIPSQFASVIRDDAAAFYHGATSVSPAVVEQTRKSLDGSLAAMRNAIAQADEFTPEQQAEINIMIDRVTKLLLDSMAEGKMDAGMLLLADQSDFQFLFGAFVSDGNEAAQILKDLAAKVQNETDAPRFKFDQGKYKDVTMHVIEADVPAGEDEARRVFGDTLRVHIGTGPKSMYVAVGNDSEAKLKALIDSSGTDTVTDRPISQMQVNLLPILQFAQSIEQNDAISAMIDALSRASDSGVIRIVSDSIDNGASTRMTIGEGLLQAVGAAVQQAQAQQAGQF